MSAEFFRKAGDAWVVSGADSEKAVQMLAEREIEELTADPAAVETFLRRVGLYYGIPQATARAALDAALEKHRVSVRIYSRETLRCLPAVQAEVTASESPTLSLTEDQLERFFLADGE